MNPLWWLTQVHKLEFSRSSPVLPKSTPICPSTYISPPTICHWRFHKPDFSSISPASSKSALWCFINQIQSWKFFFAARNTFLMIDSGSHTYLYLQELTCPTQRHNHLPTQLHHHTSLDTKVSSTKVKNDKCSLHHKTPFWL